MQVCVEVSYMVVVVVVRSIVARSLIAVVNARLTFFLYTYKIGCMAFVCLFIAIALANVKFEYLAPYVLVIIAIDMNLV